MTTRLTAYFYTWRHYCRFNTIARDLESPQTMWESCPFDELLPKRTSDLMLLPPAEENTTRKIHTKPRSAPRSGPDWRILHVLTPSVDIDDVFHLPNRQWRFAIKRQLHGLKIWISFSRDKNNILLTRYTTLVCEMLFCISSLRVATLPQHISLVAEKETSLRWLTGRQLVQGITVTPPHGHFALSHFANFTKSPDNFAI